MKAKIAGVLLSGLLVACAQQQPPQAVVSPTPAAAPAPAPAPTQAAGPPSAPANTTVSPPGDHYVEIQRALCQDMLKLSPDDRAAAAMFYIGYQASRSRSTRINVSVIPSIEDQAYVYCQENPNRPVVQVFAEAYSRIAR